MQAKMIAGHELTPGKTVKDHFHVEGSELDVPHVLLCGEQPGPTVLITAGIHNAEYVGIQAAIELSNELDVSALRGNVVLVPLGNRSGFENRTMSRVFEDGKNLNRVFPGDREGSEAERLAHMLFEVFIRNADAYIDLHCGDGYETLIPYCYYLGDAPAEETAKRMVECVNVKYVVRSHCRTGGAYNLAAYWTGTGPAIPSRSCWSITTTRPAPAAGTRRKSRATVSGRAKSLAKSATISAKPSLRSSHPQTGCCCIRPRR